MPERQQFSKAHKLKSKYCHTDLKISLSHKIAHSLDHPDGSPVRLSQPVKEFHITIQCTVSLH